MPRRRCNHLKLTQYLASYISNSAPMSSRWIRLSTIQTRRQCTIRNLWIQETWCHRHNTRQKPVRRTQSWQIKHAICFYKNSINSSRQHFLGLLINWSSKETVRRDLNNSTAQAQARDRERMEQATEAKPTKTRRLSASFSCAWRRCMMEEIHRTLKQWDRCRATLVTMTL